MNKEIAASYIFPQDEALSSDAMQLLSQRNEYSEDVHYGTLKAARLWGVEVGAATSERWRRVLAWCQPMDEILEMRSDPMVRDSLYNDVAGAVAPEPWIPNLEHEANAKTAFQWAHTVRSSLEDASINAERRRRMHETVLMIGRVSVDKMYAVLPADYMRTRRVEAILLADLLTECFSDDEMRQPNIPSFRDWYRKIMRANCMSNSADDYMTDVNNNDISIPLRPITQMRLRLNTLSEFLNCCRITTLKSISLFVEITK